MATPKKIPLTLLQRAKLGQKSYKGKPLPVPCEFCPNVIWAHNEVGGKVHRHEGQPICAQCRIMKSTKVLDRIVAGKAKRQRAEQRKADREMRKIAMASQTAHPEVRLKKN